MEKTITIGVFALQGDVREHRQILEELGVVTVAVRRPDELASCDALVLPGGESTTMSKLATTFGLFELIAQRVRSGMPVLGTCAGLILLARSVRDGRADQQTFGAIDMTVRRNAFGRQIDSFETDLDFAGLSEPVRAVFIRAPWVEQVGDGVEILATARVGQHDRIVAVRQGHAMATAFHPEVNGDNRIHRQFVELVSQHLGRKEGF